MRDATFSGSRGRGRGNQSFQHTEQPPKEKNDIQLLLEAFLSRRYDTSTKLLNLAAIASDEAVLKAGMFDSESTQKKFFPALMIVCDTMLPTRQEKIDAIESVSLAGNNVPNLNAIYELVRYMNHIKNLDLSGNKFEKLDALKPWKLRFKYLEHLVVDPFPDMGWEDEITSWFPKLKLLNGKQVRSDTNHSNNNNTNAASVIVAAPIALPNMSKEQEDMIAFVQQATHLTREYAIQCLEAGQWNLQQASDLFVQSRDTLPPNAFG